MDFITWTQANPRTLVEVEPLVCTKCGSVVAPLSAETHGNWHDALGQ